MGSAGDTLPEGVADFLREKAEKLGRARPRRQVRKSCYGAILFCEQFSNSILP